MRDNFCNTTWASVSKSKVAINPKHPERICWGCDKYCSADDLRCGNGTIRTQHPVELFGEDWFEWELSNQTPSGTVNAQQDDTPNQRSEQRLTAGGSLGVHKTEGGGIGYRNVER